MEYSSLSTPSLLIELNRVEQNCRFMLKRAKDLDVRLRPHMKTHKCVEIGRLQVGAHTGPITVSTLAEAQYFSRHGFDDILLGVPIAPCRAQEAADLGLGILVDSQEAVDAIHACPQTGIDVWLKVDCGYGRAGVLPGGAKAMALSATLHDSSRINFRGLLTHGGHSYDCVGPDEIREVAAEERDAVVSFAAELRRHGIPVPEVSVGSTPTMMHVDHLDGVTEIRPGNYALFDGFQVAIGSCKPEDVAAHVLCSVIGVYDDRVILDVGALGLSKDPGPVHVDPDCGFGQLLDLNRVPIGDLRLTGLSQEHGKAYGTGASRYSVGDKLLVVPNHSCLTMACFPEAHSIRNGGVVGTLRPTRGW